MDTGYGSLPNSYGLPWHVSDGPQLGPAWRIVDGVTHGTWSQPNGVVYVTVEGAADGYVSGWVDWNLDGDFLDSGELILANQFVAAGATVPVTFSVPVSTANQTFSARFRVYNTAQTLRAPLAPPSPTGGGPGEVEDYRWAFGPLAVTLASFDVQAQADHVLVSWETVSELGNAGFNLYRTSAAAAQPGPADLLAFVSSQAPGASQGASYGFRDSNVLAGQVYWYWLADVDLGGATTLHGPVSIVYSAPTAVGLTILHAGGRSVPALSLLLVLLALSAALLLAGMQASKRTSAV
jgi:hypothetical protein